MSRHNASIGSRIILVSTCMAVSALALFVWASWSPERSQPVRKPLVPYATLVRADSRPAAHSVSTQRRATSSGIPWRRRDCCDYYPEARELRLTIYHGMTLSDLGSHFNLTPAQIKAANPSIRGDLLLAGQQYLIPTSHLKALFHTVKKDDTQYNLVRRYGLKGVYSLRTWNCLPSEDLRIGDRLLIFQPRKANRKN
jgi:hypothetical protein